MFEGSRRIRVVIPFVAALVLAPAAGAAEHPNAGALSGRLHELSGHELRTASAASCFCVAGSTPSFATSRSASRACSRASASESTDASPNVSRRSRPR